MPKCSMKGTLGHAYGVGLLRRLELFSNEVGYPRKLK